MKPSGRRLTVEVPGFGRLEAAHLVLDYNGTIAVDGALLPGVGDALIRLAEHLTVHIVTADTFGTVQEAVAGLPCRVHVLPPGKQDERKEAFVHDLGAAQTVGIGNGRNDGRMLAASALGIAVILEEGASVAAIRSADVICTDILSALDLLAHPKRLVATLRT